jgi:hypothetical protein
MRTIDLLGRIGLVAMALLAPAIWQAPVHAQQAQAAPLAVDPYLDLYAAMEAVLDSDQEYDKALQEAEREMWNMPQFVSLERRFPGSSKAVTAAMRPWLRKQSERINQRYKPRVVALMKQELEPDDARKLAAYFRTERGRRFLLDMSPEPAPPIKPLGQPTAFLAPATGHNPASVKPAAPAKTVDRELLDPAVAAVVGDPVLRARATAFFLELDPIVEEMDNSELDKDIAEGMFRAMDYAASTYGVRLFEEPL